MANVITVAALNKYTKTLLESDPVLTDIAVKGEISNFKCHYATGHCYFSLKDEYSSVSAVMFRGDASRLAFQPENGMAVIARCRVSLFERDGRFQLYVQDLFPDGLGAAQMAFEQLKARLAAEGLFAQEVKKPLPKYPRTVGLVTSKTGAALQDILKVAARRCPTAEFILHPVTVQGQAAAPEITRAIQSMDKAGCDVLIVARGGGSAEDLGVFNTETIARAVYACHTPVISAIGHEIDFTILDFVADCRAPTPSAAAELALPDMRAEMQGLLNIYTKIAENIHARRDSCYNRLNTARQHRAFARVRELPAESKAYMADVRVRIVQSAEQSHSIRQARLQAAAALAHSLNPYAVLARGYGVVQKQGATVRSTKTLKKGDNLTIVLADGTAGCTVTDTESNNATGEG